MTRAPVRAATVAAALAAAGLVVGLLAAVEHRQRSTLGGLDLPWGMALALGASWLGGAASEVLARRGSTWFALGWAVHLLLASTGGGYLVADDASGWIYTLAGVAGLLVVVVGGSLWRTRRPAGAGRAAGDDPT